MARFISPALTALGLALMVAALAACDDDTCDVPVSSGAPDIEDAPGLRNPETGICESVGGPGIPGGDNCGDFGGDNNSGGLAEPAPLPDHAQCFAGCEGLDEPTCTDTASCRAIYLSDCPFGTECLVSNYEFVDCWGVAPASPDSSLECEGLNAYNCSRSDGCSAQHGQAEVGGLGGFERCVAERDTSGPGSCVGEPACDAPPPDCPAGTIAGRTDECWTGFCVPLDECDQVLACSSLGERDCIGRADCGPDYRGDNCTCDATGCTCTDLTFGGCGDL
jgi:hypothetical protein